MMFTEEDSVDAKKHKFKGEVKTRPVAGKSPWGGAEPPKFPKITPFCKGPPLPPYKNFRHGGGHGPPSPPLSDGLGQDNVGYTVAQRFTNSKASEKAI